MKHTKNTAIKIGQRLRIVTDKGVYKGLVVNSIQDRLVEYYGYLDNGAGMFSIVDCKTHFSGSVTWSQKMRRQYNSFIEDFTND